MNGKVKRTIPWLLTLALAACGGGGGGGGSDTPGGDATNPPPSSTDVTAPEGYSVSFSAESVDFDNQNSLGFTLANAESGANYNYSITSSAGGGTVSGTGTAMQTTVNVSALDVSSLEDGTLTVSITLRDAAGNTGLAATDSIEKAVGAGLVQVSGTATFDLVLQVPKSGALDYSNIQATPIRGVDVEAIDRNGTVLASGESDELGRYSLDLPIDTEVQILVKAQMRRSGSSSWDIQVTDNTNDNALYILAGSYADTGGEDSSRDLHAASGWGGVNYTEVRAAAPFSILYYLYDAVERLIQIEPDLSLGNLNVRWSVKNGPAQGSITEGDLGSSFYRRGDGIYLLGKEDVDTEEYDPYVIVHEFGHFLQDTLSRDDTIGGSHDVVQFLDMRVAFSEGLASAIAAMLLDDPLFRDSGGFRQEGTLAFFDIEDNPTEGQGWFVEGSVQAILYDLYDASSDKLDDIELGLEPLLMALMDAEFADSPFFTTIFSFIDQLTKNLSETGNDLGTLAALVEDQMIFGVGNNGIGETNSGGVSSVLPVYNEITVSGAPTILCSVAKNGIYNKLGNRAFGRLMIDQQGVYTLRMERESGKNLRDPDFIVHSLGSGRPQQRFEGSETNLEVGSVQLEPGHYIIEAFDAFNTEVELDDVRSGNACYEFSVMPG